MIIDGKWLFIGTDRRLFECSQIMKKWGNQTFHYDGDEYTDRLSSMIDEISPAHIVFPILELNGNIPIDKLSNEIKLYPGVASNQWLAPYIEAGVSIHPYLKEVEYVWENARLTAEGFLLEYYAATKRRISGEHFYITGFGKVAKMTAQVLSSLGGAITILARSPNQLGEAAAIGYNTIELKSGKLNLQGTLINTIPAKWLEVSEGTDLRIFDLASAPGCLKANTPDEYYTIHLGLPGKHFPVDAANSLAEALLRMNSR